MNCRRNQKSCFSVREILLAAKWRKAISGMSREINSNP